MQPTPMKLDPLPSEAPDPPYLDVFESTYFSGRKSLPSRKWQLFAVLLCIGATAAAFVPFGNTVSLDAVVGSTGDVIINAPLGGVIKSVHATDGQWVKQGQPLLEFDASALYASRDVLLHERRALEAERVLAESRDDSVRNTDGQNKETAPSHRRQVLDLKIVANTAALREVERTIAARVVAAPISGRIALFDVSARPGTFFPLGRPLGRMSTSRPVIWANLPASLAGEVRTGSKAIVRTPDKQDHAGIVTSVSFAPDPVSRTYRVQVTVPSLNDFSSVAYQAEAQARIAVGRKNLFDLLLGTDRQDRTEKTGARADGKTPAAQNARHMSWQGACLSIA